MSHPAGTITEDTLGLTNGQLMPPLQDQFKDALKNIEPDEDATNAITAHEEVRAALDASDDLREAGLDTVLIGSYARHVSIYRMRDVDVLCRLPDYEGDDPDALLDLVEEVLCEAFGDDRVERQDRSVKVDFPDFDLTVDAVPARPCGDHWEIPDGEGGWQETNPLELEELTHKMNADNDEHYVPTVKLVRQTRRAQLGDSQPGGLYLEIATYHAFSEGIDAHGRAGYFVGGLEGVVAQLEAAVDDGLDDPTLDGEKIGTRATSVELQAAADRFKKVAEDARDALDSDDPCWAAKTFRDILGKNSDDEWVFPMPSYCNEDGTKKSAVGKVAAGSSQISGGDGRYA
jgi:hypothetical protein